MFYNNRYYYANFYYLVCGKAIITVNKDFFLFLTGKVKVILIVIVDHFNHS